MTSSHSHPGIRISELPLIRAVGIGDFVVINDNDSTTTKISFSDFIQSIHNIKGEVDLKVYAEDVIIKAPGGDTNPLWEVVGGYVPLNQSQANDILLTEVETISQELKDISVIINDLEQNDGRYVTKEYVDQQIQLEKEAREAQDQILMNIKADKYNTYTKEEVDALVGTDLYIGNRTATGFDVVSSTGKDVTLPLATELYAGIISAQDYAKLNDNITTNLSIANRTDLTLDIESSSGTDATIPAATKTLAGLLSGDDKTKLDSLTRTVDFYGSVDLTDDSTIPNRPNPINGDAYVNIATGTVDSGWDIVSDLTSGDTVTAGDIVIWNGSSWTYIPTGGIQYTDADVDAHLNTATAGDDFLLSWNGVDYEWVDSSGMGGQNLQEVTDVGNTTTNGATFKGQLDVDRVGDSEVCFTAKESGSTNYAVRADGTLLIGGTSPATGVSNTRINPDGSASFAGQVLVNRPAGTNNAFMARVDGSTNNNLLIRADGSIETTSYVTIGGTPSNPVTANIALNADDGSASFVGDVTVSSDGNIGNGAVLVKNYGEVQSIRPTGSTSAVFLGANGGTQTSWIYADGSASFVGKVISASTESSDPGTTLVTKDYLEGGDGLGGADLQAVCNVGSNTTTGATFGGLVGIGTLNPLAELHVSAGNILVDNDKGYLGKLSDDTAVRLIHIGADDHLYLNAQSSVDNNVIIQGSGTDKIIFGSDGSAIFSNIVDIYRATSDQNHTLLSLYSDVGGTQEQQVLFTAKGNMVANGNVLVGGTPGSPNISLNADGSGIFSNDVLVGGNANNGTSNGARLFASGAIKCSAVSSAVLWTGHTTGNSTATSSIKGDGSAEFAGDVEIGDFSSTEGNYLFESGGIYCKTSGTNQELLRLYEDSTINTRLFSDGSAEFAGIVQSGSADITSETTAGATLNDRGNILIQRPNGATSSDIYFSGYSGTTRTVRINGDGSASFDDNVNSKGVFYSTRQSGNSRCFVGSLDGAENFVVLADGSATFAGKVESAGTASSDTDDTLTTKSYVDALVAAGGGGGGAVADLQTVTDLGNTTTNNIELGNIDVSSFPNTTSGQKLFAGGTHNLKANSSSTGAGAADLLKLFDNNGLKTTLKSDGSAEFTGNVQSTTYDLGSSSGAGFQLSSNGAVTAQRTSGGAAVFRGYHEKSENVTINADGSAEFKGTLEINGPNRSFLAKRPDYTDGTTPNGHSFAVLDCMDAGNKTTLRLAADGSIFGGSIGNNSVDHQLSNYSLNSDGSAEFAGGNIVLDDSGLVDFARPNPGGTYGEGTRVQFNTQGTTSGSMGGAGEAFMRCRSYAADGSLTDVAGIAGDGSADFAGPVSVGPSSSSTTFVNINSNGIVSQNPTSSDQQVFFRGRTSPSDNKISLFTDGSATFVGKVESAGTASSDTAETLTTKSYVDALVAAGGGGGGAIADLQAVTDVGNTTTNGATFGSGNISLNADGSASFAGDVTASGVITDNGRAKVFLSSGDGGFYVYDSADTANPNAIINKDGSAGFASKLTINDPINSEGVELYPDGRLFTRIDNIDDDKSVLGFYKNGYDESAARVQFKADGSANFAGSFMAGPVQNYSLDTCEHIRYDNARFEIGVPKDSTADAFRVMPGLAGGSATPTVKITGDGSAIFKNYISSATDANTVNLNVDIGGTDVAFITSPDGNAVNATARINADGSALFKNQVQSLNYRVNNTAGTQLGAYGSGEWFTNSSAGDSDLVIAMATAQSLHLFDAANNQDNIILNKNGSATFGTAATQRTQLNAAAGLLLGQNGSTSVFRVDTSGNVDIGGTISGTNSGASGNDPNIVLNADGSSTFAGGNLEIRTNGQVRSKNGFLAYGDSLNSTPFRITTNNAASSSANVAVINSDGSATFAGDVVIGGDAQSGGNEGTKLWSVGQIDAARTSGSSAVFKGYTVGNGTPTVRIDADGSAEFAGDVNIAGGSSVTDSQGVTILGPSDASVRVRGVSDKAVFAGWQVGTSGNATSKINADGSSSFAGDLQIAGKPLDSSGVQTGILLRSQGRGVFAAPDGQACLQIKTTGVTGNKAAINADGSASFAGNVTNVGTAGSFSDVPQTSGNTEGSHLGGGKLQLGRPGASEIVFQAYSGNNSTPQIEFKNDGSATFAGKVVGQTIWGNNSTGAASYFVTSTTAESQASVSASNNAGGYLWRGDDGTDGTSTIKADGSATFAGRVSTTVSNIGDNAAWDLVDSNIWTASGGTIQNPSSVTAGQSGIIYCTGAVTAWGNYFKFPGGSVPDCPANSVIPYSITTNNRIDMGNPVENIS